MYQKIIFTIGIPACGKSTWCLEKIKEDSNFVQIERDEIRKLLFGTYEPNWSMEHLVSDYSDKLAMATLNEGKSVIFSNTNLNEYFLKKYIEKWKQHADIEFVVFDVDLETAIERNSKRDRFVPVAVIERMYESMKVLKTKMDFETIKKN